MPSTYNGIGTHYYGKRNVQTRPGQCRSCGRNVQLTSYDTRLWFVVVFIPIIPLGRKRIIDYCPACWRHYVVEFDKWETTRQLEISGSMEKFRASPSVDAAIEVHRQLLQFHQIAEAGEFQKLMLTQFPDNAKIYAYLGAAQEHIGRPNEAAELYGQALKLRPDLPEARIGVAQGQIRAGRLDEARVLLDFLEKPGAAQLYTLAPLETLARAYQAAGRHAEALELFRKIIEGLPKVTEHAGFRKTVKISEKALGRTTSILPKQKFSWKRLFAGGSTPRQRVAGVRALIFVGVILVLVILGFVISNEYIRHHRKLYLVNGYSTPATVEITGIGSVKNFRGAHSLNLPEGHFRAIIGGPVNEEIDFDVRDTYFNRVFGDSLWLINVGGGALLEETVATYTENPKPATTTFRTGKKFEYFHKVTHPFTTLPDRVQIDSGGSKTLVGVTLYSGEPADVFGYYLEDKHNIRGALDFAENWLHAHPEDDTIFQLYVKNALRLDTNRVETFLVSGLTNRPVRIEWHRGYQELHKNAADLPALLAKYDDLLRAEPANSAFLYLRGRLETNRDDARNYFEKSLAADPKNPFASYGLAYDHAAAGDWVGAKPLIARAVEENPRDGTFAELFYLCRLATDETQQIEKESREKLAGSPFSYSAVEHLLDALAIQNKTDEATKECNDFVARCRSQYGARGSDLIRSVQYHTYHALGDFAQVKILADKDTTLLGRGYLAWALIELGELDEAEKTIAATKELGDSEILAFSLAVAHRLKGDEAAGARWEARGIELLAKDWFDSSTALALLNRGAAPTRAEAEGVAIPPQSKAIIMAMLAQKYPQSRAEFADLANKLNVGRDFAYYLVRRAAAPAP